MKLPQTIKDLIDAQNNSDSIAYVECFSENAIVKDEGKTYSGKQEIKQWISKTNETYKITMNPLEYSVDKQVLKAEISGDFASNPIVLSYQFNFKEEKISFLEID